jgi:hypothetical protein
VSWSFDIGVGTILDRPGLEAEACESYGVIKSDMDGVIRRARLGLRTMWTGVWVYLAVRNQLKVRVARARTTLSDVESCQEGPTMKKKAIALTLSAGALLLSSATTGHAAGTPIQEWGTSYKSIGLVPTPV